MVKIYSPEILDLKNHQEIDENMIRDKIAEDPSILGLGDLILKDQDRPQPKAGILDLLLQDPVTKRRYEVEIQLGKTDETHIIRTIEYWDIEKRRYPQYDHCAVIVAENITTRFLNVISLFNGCIPLIAIQMTAIKNGNDCGLLFTKILNELPLGYVDDDEEIKEVTDRNYWLNRGTEDTVKIADYISGFVNDIHPGFTLKYNKYYIGLSKNGRTNNFVVCKPQKNSLRLELKLPKSDDIDAIINSSTIDELGYDEQREAYLIRLTSKDLKNQENALKNLLQSAYTAYYS